MDFTKEELEWIRRSLISRETEERTLSNMNNGYFGDILRHTTNEIKLRELRDKVETMISKKGGK